MIFGPLWRRFFTDAPSLRQMSDKTWGLGKLPEVYGYVLQEFGATCKIYARKPSSTDERFARQYRYEPPPEHTYIYIYIDIDRHMLYKKLRHFAA